MERYFSAKIDLEGRGLAGSAAAERTQWAEYSVCYSVFIK